ncbi:hypothetical protein GCM10017161_34130 [Thalassotalea marina]|uniref:Type II secretion system protein H n=2 Tax=Thalassotalea marina TaxID=1673741 RepID=A0A919EMD8_9GAMM|nr:hypothetical protein GCM10017161_34130 [Thalassotalea marina]
MGAVVMTRCKQLKLQRQLVKGMTLIEILITLTIIGLASLIALPALSEFTVKTRVDAEVIELQRFLITARNAAINSGKQVTVCPLSNGACTNGWKNQLTIFVNENDNNNYNAANEQIVKIKADISSDDIIKFTGGATLVYSPTGRLIGGNNVAFTYCPKNYNALARGVNIALSGRAYLTQDTDNDGKDEDRNGNELNCT